jgi:hypothetical protein
MQKALNERFFFLCFGRNGYFPRFLCPLATQLFRVGNQRPIDFYPIAIVDPILKLTGRL